MIVQRRTRRDASVFAAMINIQFLLVCSWERQDKSRGPTLKTADEEEEIWQSSKCEMYFCIIELLIML